MDKVASVFGILSLVGIAWLFSEGKRHFPFRTVLWGLTLQVLLGILVLGIPAAGVPGVLHFLFEGLNEAFLKLIGFTDFGAKFMFGALVDTQQAWGFIFAFKVLPSIIFFSALVAILYHLGVLQKVVMLLARVMTRTMGTSGAESLSTAGNIFLGQTEAPLLIKPFVATMTRSELFLIMAGGMANTAGSVLAAYVGLLSTRIPDIAGHLLTMSILSAPASILICKVMVPEREVPLTRGRVELKDERIDANVIEAAARGTSEGLQLALNVAAMLIAFIAIVAGINFCLEIFGQWISFSSWAPRLVEPVAGTVVEPLKFSLQWVFGWIFAPIAWLMGIPWKEAAFAGTFLGEKVVLNEFVAYVHLTEVAGQLSHRTVVILSYALCGFANFASIGIMLGGIGLMAPSRRGELARMGLLAVVGGNLASFMTAAVAGLLI